MDERRRFSGTFCETSIRENRGDSGASNDHGLDTVSMQKLVCPIACGPSEGSISCLGAGVTVVEIVVALGTRRYELQNEVAAGPRTFRAPRTPVTTWQFTPRGSSAAPVARAEQEAGASCGAQLTSAAATETSESKSALSSIMLMEVACSIVN